MKIFKIEFDAIFWECEIRIDPDFKSDYGGQQTTCAEQIKEMVEFWTDWEDAVGNADGDYVKAFALQLAKECFHIAYSNNYNTHGVVEEFEGKEGYCKMDGSNGIWITHTDDAVIGDQEFTVTETAE